MAADIEIPSPDLCFYGPAGRLGVAPRDFRRTVEQASAILNQRSAKGDRVAVVYRTGPALLAWWFAAMTTRRVPLIIQYPTEKQAAGYWTASVAQTLKSCEIRHLFIDPAVSRGKPATWLASHYWSLHEVAPSEIAEGKAGFGTNLRGLLSPAAAKLTLSPDALFLQQSSGTTGHRKGIEYRLGDVATHVGDFNKVISLTGEDCLVSWLPLYHDMGFVACFLMPLLLGIRLVLIDPMDWVTDKGLLTCAIAAEKGTVCYMPNFGFEVMSHLSPSAPVDTMRLWVSCSEPSRRSTLERFAQAYGVTGERIASCYAMAENIFAVCFRRGVQARGLDSAEVVSCGPPIPGVEIVVRDGEVFVKSSYAVRSYIGIKDLRTADGYYGTGDLGEIIDGELYLTGRRADLLNQSGQKFLLSDIDHIVNEALSWAKGRVASTAVAAEGSAPELCRIFIESTRFFDERYQIKVAEVLRPLLPMPHFDVVLVPPAMIAKTSSGKVNRRDTARRWDRRERQARAGVRRTAKSLMDLLPGVNLDAPLLDAVDSLGLLIVEMAIGGVGLSDEERQLSVRQLEEKYLSSTSDADAPSAEAEEYRIAVLSDPGIRILRIDNSEHQRLERELGRPVHIDYVCMPPAKIILQYLTFLDWFAAETLLEATEPMRRALEILRNASIIVADDQTEMAHGYCAYPVLDFDGQRHPLADLLVYRYQLVAQNNHELPIAGALLGYEIPLAERGSDLTNLGDYLGIPVLKVGLDAEFKQFTKGWDLQTVYPRDNELSDDELQKEKRIFIDALRNKLHEKGRLRSPGRMSSGVRASDQTHYCCFFMNPMLINAVLDQYDRFLFFGPEVNYHQFLREATRRGKKAGRIGSLDRNGKLPAGVEGYDCVVQAGPWYKIDTDLPVLRLMHGHPPDAQNFLKFNQIGAVSDLMYYGDMNAGYQFDAIYLCQPPKLDIIRKHFAVGDSDLAPIFASSMNLRQPITAAPQAAHAGDAEPLASVMGPIPGPK